MERAIEVAQHRVMLRRTVALALWVYFAWYLGSMIATATGLPSLLGPAAGALMAFVAVIDWRKPDHAMRRTVADIRT